MIKGVKWEKNYNTIGRSGIFLKNDNNTRDYCHIFTSKLAYSIVVYLYLVYNCGEKVVSSGVEWGKIPLK